MSASSLRVRTGCLVSSHMRICPREKEGGAEAQIRRLLLEGSCPLPNERAGRKDRALEV